MQPHYNYRRNLPHYQPGCKTFFISFCTYQRWILPPVARDIVMQTCFRGNGHRCQLHAIVVMPDHVHLALNPRRDQQGWEFTIPTIMQEIKSIFSHRINRELMHSGRVWQEESFDRAMRSADDLDLKIEYMINNPVRAGIVSAPSEYRWLWTERFGEFGCAGTGEAPVAPL